MKSVAIVGVTSYTALELLRMLAQHPQFVVTSVTARSAVGKRLDEVFPQLQALATSSIGNVDPTLVVSEEPTQTDLAFVCLPHAAAAESIVTLLERGTRVVDLSADFRLKDVGIYEEWYRHTHPAPSLLETSVYGLCERYRAGIEHATLVANPGCHSTTAILALLPAVAAGIIGRDIIIDSKTGVSGAGRSLSLTTHYAEANEDVNAYSLEGHRHLPEILQELEAQVETSNRTTDAPFRITFVPHLIPMTRGILATCYADLMQTTQTTQTTLTTADVQALYKQYYENEPFVHVVDTAPHTKWSYGSNHCFIHPFVDSRTHRLVIVACLDNLVKGASGQAVQNANCMYGFSETMGLTALSVYP